jgi:LysM repeat protein
MKKLRVLVALLVLLMAASALPAQAAGTEMALHSSPAVAQSFVYFAVPGDTLNRIAARFGVTLSALLRANPAIVNPNRIRVGQRLVIPVSSPPTFTRVKIALIALNDGGPVGCGDSTVLVTRSIAPTTAPLTAAVRELISLHTPYYGQSGLFDALYQSQLSVQSVGITNGHATIRLAGSLASGGVCDDPRIVQQFEDTALQFSTVHSVSVLVNGIPLTDLLSGR